MSIDKAVALTALIGKTLRSIGTEVEENTAMFFECIDGTTFHAGHRSGSMQTVYLHEKLGQDEDILGEPIVHVEEVSGQKETAQNPSCSSTTITLWEIRTGKGKLILRWHGESDGGAHISPYLYELDKPLSSDDLECYGISFYANSASLALSA